MQQRTAGMIIVAAIAAGCSSVRPREVPVGAHFRVMTYNVNWGGPRPDLAAKAIARADADIVCLQEATAAWADYLRENLGAQYPFMKFSGLRGRGAGGMAFLSKQPGEQIAYVRSGTKWFDGWIMKFPTPASPVQILNLHLQPPANERGSITVSSYLTSGSKHLAEIKRFHKDLQPDIPTLIVGDFNEEDDGDAISWLEEKGMTNALPEFDRKSKTWRWRVGLVTLRKRLDHIVYSPGIRCYGANVLKAGASDHLPVVAVFGIQEEE